MASTHRFYAFNLTLHILPVLGDKHVAAIKRADCRDLLNACRTKGLKPASMLGVNRTLSAVLSQAVEDELLAANPAFRMGKHLRSGFDLPAEIPPLTREEGYVFLLKAEHVFPEVLPVLPVRSARGCGSGNCWRSNGAILISRVGSSTCDATALAAS
jgi:hypothetical protein